MTFDFSTSVFGKVASMSPVRQLIVLLVLSIIGLSLASFISVVILTMGFGYSLNDLSSFSTNPELPGALNVLRISQFFTSIGVFIFPALTFFSLSRPKIELGWRRIHGMPAFWLAFCALLMVSQLPLINALADWNKSLVFPESLRLIETWMQSQELQAEKLTEAFLTMDSVSDVLLSLVIMAVIPAIGEELLFRGALQAIISRITHKPHLAIWITAFVFSFIHFQFYGFLPRFLLGAFLGYLFYWSGSIWFPIVAHFANNGLAVLATYADQHGMLNVSGDDFGTGNNGLYEIGFSIICLGLGMYIFYRQRVFHDQIEVINDNS
jgi:uncharacterized protein